MDRKTCNELDRAWTSFIKAMKEITRKEKGRFGSVCSVSFEPPEQEGDIVTINSTIGNPLYYLVSALLLLHDALDHVDDLPEEKRKEVLKTANEAVLKALKGEKIFRKDIIKDFDEGFDKK